MKRHNLDITLKKPEKLSTVRARMLCVVNTYFDEMGEVITGLGVSECLLL